MAEQTIEVRQVERRPLVVVVQGRLEIGRDCDGLLVADERTSRCHVSLEATTDGLVVADLDSTNGTYVNGRPISSPTRVRPGDVIVVGDTEISLHGAKRAARPERSPSRETLGPASSATASGSASPRVHPVDHTVERPSIATVAEEVLANDLPRLRAHAEGTVTILFTDIVTSTELTERFGDSRWMEVLDAHTQLVRHLLREHGGTEVKSQGDGFMLSFPSARRGIGFACALQRALRLDSERRPDRALSVRIGLHTGDAIADSGDVFGKHVILASRIAALAGAGQVLLSDLAYELARGTAEVVFGPPQRVELKGLSGSYGIREAQWWEPAAHPSVP